MPGASAPFAPPPPSHPLHATALDTVLLLLAVGKVPKIVDLLLFTALHRQPAPPALDHIGLFFFLRGKTVFIFLPLLLASCLATSALSSLKSCTNIFGTLAGGPGWGPGKGMVVSLVRGQGEVEQFGRSAATLTL